MANAFAGVKMLLGAAMHSQSIAFHRGGTLATAPLFAPTLGHHRLPRLLTPRPGPSIEKGQRKGRAGSFISIGTSLRKKEGNDFLEGH